MELDDKTESKAQEAADPAEQGFGQAAGDGEPQAASKADPEPAKMSQAGQKIKDIFKR